jgi:putative acetyltransferase
VSETPAGPVVRAERPSDILAVYAVHAASFPTSVEATLVDALREAGQLVVSLVAESSGVVVGHVAFSPVFATGSAKGVGLAPLAVRPEHRRRGVGAALVRSGIAACQQAGFGWCVVLGEPEYYARFGFRPATTFGLRDEYGGGDAFQAIELAPGELPTGVGLVRYAPAFGQFG